MRHTQHLAHQYNLSRRVLMVAFSKEDNLYKVHVEIQGLGRTELNYYFIEGTAHVSQACEAAVDRATELFLGVSSVVAAKVEQQVEMKLENTTPVQGEQNEKSIKQEDSSKQTESKSSSEKSNRRSKKVEKESAPQTAQAEEMEAVESPYKETKPESEVKESSPVKSKQSTAEPYNREDKASKGSFASYATKLHGGSKDWKLREDLKDISSALHGMPFIEKDGSIHPDFEEKCKELFGLDTDAL